jgi:hypothetical protein
MNDDDPVAPWEEFPYPPISMGWRMGDGEDFFYYWVAWWDLLTEREQAEYLSRHRASPDWVDWAADRRRWLRSPIA